MSRSLVEKLRPTLYPGLLAKVQGCTEEDLQKLMQWQRVSFLPATYRELMLYMGRYGMDWVLPADSSVEMFYPELKDAYLDVLELEGLSCPSDVFIFLDTRADVAAFFRTATLDDDPPVFVMGYGDFFFKAANSFTEYVFAKMDEVPKSGTERRTMVACSAFRYDAEKDIFYQVTEIDNRIR